MRVLLLHHPYTYPRFEQDFVDRVAELPEFDVVADPGMAPTLAWGDFTGLRVLMDHDIIQNYSDIFDATLGGT
ncbi:MAG: hypothetical protein IPK33_08770 [Gemmatimonadetes bacterium]|nr:hypothetical protein [Gemmatimonadota bacterium]